MPVMSIYFRIKNFYYRPSLLEVIKNEEILPEVHWYLHQNHFWRFVKSRFCFFFFNLILTIFLGRFKYRVLLIMLNDGRGRGFMLNFIDVNFLYGKILMYINYKGNLRICEYICCYIWIKLTLLFLAFWTFNTLHILNIFINYNYLDKHLYILNILIFQTIF